MLPLDNSCPAGGANIGTVGLVCIHYWWKGVEGKCLLWSSNRSSNVLARWQSQMLMCDRSSNASKGLLDVWQWQQCVWRLRRTLKAVAEVKMAAAIGIILYFSSVIVVVCVFCLAYVELYNRNSSKGNIAIFPSSQGIYPAGGGISQAWGNTNWTGNCSIPSPFCVWPWTPTA